MEQTLKSVKKQTCRDYEHIVIDGGSTDGSKKLIEDYADYITFWVSEPDDGAYQAMNKGMREAKGEYCLFVNSGDQLYSPDTISQILENSLKTDIVMGEVKNIGCEGVWSPFPEGSISAVYLRDNPIHHPGALIRTSLQRKFPYNENLKICADRQFFMETLVLHNCTYSTIPVVISRFAPAGLSSKANDRLMAEEDDIYLSRLFPHRLLRDLSCTNDHIQTTTRLMARHYRLMKIMVRANNFILRFVNKLERPKK